MAGTKTILAGVCEYVDEYKSTYVRKLYILCRYLDRDMMNRTLAVEPIEIVFTILTYLRT